MQKDLLSLSERREHHYSREKLLPEKVLDILPYKLTYEALLQEDEEKLNQLIINSTIRKQLIHFY